MFIGMLRRAMRNQPWVSDDVGLSSSTSILLGFTCNYMQQYDDGAINNVLIKPVLQ